MGSIVESFSYRPKYLEYIKEARRIAKENEISFSNFIIEAIQLKVDVELGKKKVYTQEDEDFEQGVIEGMIEQANEFE